MVQQRLVKVLYIHSSRFSSGASIDLHRLVCSLNLQKFQPIIACRDPRLFSSCEKHGALIVQSTFPSFEFATKTVYLSKTLSSSLYWRALKRVASLAVTLPKHLHKLITLCHTHQPDIIHLNGESLFMTAILARILGRKVIVHVRAEAADNFFGRLVHTLINIFAHQIIAVSKVIASSFREDKTHVIPFMPLSKEFTVDSFAKKKSCEAGGIPVNATCVGFVGRLSEAKGIFDFIDAAPMILAEIPSAHFLAVGGVQPGIDHYLKARIAHDNLSDRFHLVGHVANTAEYVSFMDVVTFPSLTEGFGLAIAEALAMSKPVVITDIHGIRDFLISDVHCLVIPPNSPSDLAHAVVRFLKDLDLASRCGQQGQQLILSLNDDGIRNLETIYRRLAEY